MDLRDEAVEERRPWDGREGAHAARVGTGVAVARALEVAGGCEGNGSPSVADREDRQLLALEQLLDVKARAERLNLREGGLQLVVVVADEHALARGQAVGLDDARRSRHRKRARRRHAGPLEHVLRERLRPLDARAGRSRPEDGDASAAQAVGEPGDERCFRADDDEVDAQRAREREHAVAVRGEDGMTAPELGDARIPRCGVQLVEPRALGDLPGECVLASTRADDEHPHDYDPAMPGDEPAAPPYSATAVELTRYPGGDERDLVAVEEPLEIRINGAPVAVTMRTPGARRGARARLLPLGGDAARRRGRCRDDLAANTVDVEAPGFDPERLRRSFYMSSSCGVCGKGAIEAVAVEAARVESELRVPAPLLALAAGPAARSPGRVRGDGRVARGRAVRGGRHAAVRA